MRPAEDAAFSDRLIYALRLEALGFGEDAGEVWRRLAGERPEDPTLRSLAPLR